MANNGGVVIVVAGEDQTGSVFNAVQKHLGDVRAAADKSNASLGSVGSLLRQGLGVYSAVSAGRMLIDVFKGIVGSSVATAMELGHLSQQTGISAQNLAVLRYASQQSGVDFEVLTKAFKKLSTSVYEWQQGGAKAAAAFAAIGISQKNLQATGGDMYRVLELIADRFASMPDGIKKNAIASELFGRAGQQLIPILDQGAAGIERYRGQAEALGLVLDTAGIQKMEALHSKVIEMKGAFEGLALEITTDTAPALEQLANSVTKLMQDFKDNPMKGFTEFMLPGVTYKDTPQELQARRLKDLLSQSSHPLLAAPTGTKPEFQENPEEANKIAAAQKRLADTKMQLAEAADRLEETRAKSAAEQELAILEGLHKQGLVSDANYFTERASIEQTAFDKERAALEAQQAAIQSRMDAVHKTKPKGKADQLAQEAELNDLSKQSIDLNGKILDLQGHQVTKEQELATARAESLKRQAEAIAAMEADLEKLSGNNSQKAIAEQRLKSGEQRKDLANGGASPAQLAEFDAFEKLKEQKLQIEALDRRSEQISRAAALAEAQVQQEQLSHTISQAEAEEKLRAIRAGEITQLQGIAAAYAQYGEAGLDSEARIQQSITQNMQQIQKETNNQLQQAVEGYAHAIFDPLFEMNEKWNKRWKQMRDGILKDTGQLAEKQLFGALFGDDSGKRGGGTKGRSGIMGQGEGLLSGLLGGLFGKKGAGVASNGGLGSGAGTIPSAAASVAQMGLGAGATGSGGVQIVINNTGAPVQASQASQTSDGGEGQVIQIMLKQLETNGPVAQGILGLISL